MAGTMAPSAAAKDRTSLLLKHAHVAVGIKDRSQGTAPTQHNHLPVFPDRSYLDRDR